MATAAEKQREQQREKQARAAALAAGGTAVAAGDGKTPGAGVPAATVRATAAATVVAALVAFLTAERAREGAWLTDQLRRRQPRVAVDDVTALVNEEQARASEFERRSTERFTRGLTHAMAIADPERRQAAIDALVRREQVYVRQRQEAMAARAFAAVDRVVLRIDSPQGAFWKLDPTVIEHTAGCLFMGGQFWPWKVLDRLHPPRHYGCPCRLLGYAEAIADGWMGPGDVPDVAAAVRKAAHVVMEGVIEVDPADAHALLLDAYGDAETAQLRQAMLAAGLTTAERFDALLPA